MSASKDIVDKHMMDTITIRLGGQEWRVDTAVMASNSGLIARALRGEVQVPGFANNTLCVPVDLDGIAEQTIDLMVDFFQAGGESVAAAFVKKGRVAYKGKIWVNSIEKGTDVLQQLRDFFITASVFESPSMERMLKMAVAVNFNKIVAKKGPPERHHMHDAFDYEIWIYILTLGLGVAFDPSFVPERLDIVREDADEVVQAMVDDMADIVAGPAPKKRKAEGMSVDNSTVDETESPDPKRNKVEKTIARDTGEIVLPSRTRQLDGDTTPGRALTSSPAGTDSSDDKNGKLAATDLDMTPSPSTPPRGSGPQPGEQQHHLQPPTPASKSSKRSKRTFVVATDRTQNSRAAHDSSTTCLHALEATPDNSLRKNPSGPHAGPSPPPSPLPPAAAGAPMAADATCAHSSSNSSSNSNHDSSSPSSSHHPTPPHAHTHATPPLPPPNPHLGALRAALLDGLWTHHLDLLSSPSFLRYLSAQPHLSAGLFGRFLLLARNRSGSSKGGGGRPTTTTTTTVRRARELLSCPEWLARMAQPGAEDHARAFWASAAALQEWLLKGRAQKEVGRGGRRGGARLAEGRHRESPF